MESETALHGNHTRTRCCSAGGEAQHRLYEQFDVKFALEAACKSECLPPVELKESQAWEGAGHAYEPLGRHRRSPCTGCLGTEYDLCGLLGDARTREAHASNLLLVGAVWGPLDCCMLVHPDLQRSVRQ